MPAPKGNSNAKKGRQWADAIKQALMEYEDSDVKRGEALRAIGRKLIKKSLEDGDMQAIKEIGDRLDGKPHQSISGADDGPIEASIRVTFGRD